MQVPCSPAAGALSTPETPGVTAERALLLFEELQSSPARLVGSCSGPAASADAHLPRRAHALGSGGAAAGKLREALTVVTSEASMNVDPEALSATASTSTMILGCPIV